MKVLDQKDKVLDKNEKSLDQKQKNVHRKQKALLVLGLLLMCAPISASAMHIMEGYLPFKWAVIWYIVFLPFMVLGLRAVKTLMSQDMNIKLLLGLVAAFAFCLSALKIPSVVGSCSHPTGVGLGAMLFGPLPMVVIGGVVLLLQSLLLAHGGITTLGANGFSMAVAGPFASYGIYKLCLALKLNKKWAIFLGAMIGDLVTYSVTSIQLGLAFPGSEGVMVAVVKYLGIFMFTQLPIAVGEGILTVLVYNLLIEFKAQLGRAGEVL